MFNDPIGDSSQPRREEAQKVRKVIILLETAIRECERYLRSIEQGADDRRK